MTGIGSSAMIASTYRGCVLLVMAGILQGTYSLSPSALSSMRSPHSFAARETGCQRIAHVVNSMPFSDLSQNITLESMAQAATNAGEKGLAVDLYTVFLDGEDARIPKHPNFTVLPTMNRSFQTTKSLPYARDILLKLHEKASDADCFVYTNADIALSPQFYMRMSEKLAEGYDVINVHRTTVLSDELHGTVCIPGGACPQMPQVLELARDIGQPNHPGEDCFVYRRSVAAKMMANIGDVYLGYPPIGAEILSALSCATMEKMRHYQVDEKSGDGTLTAHLGDGGDNTLWEHTMNGGSETKHEATNKARASAYKMGCCSREALSAVGASEDSHNAFFSKGAQGCSQFGRVRRPFGPIVW